MSEGNNPYPDTIGELYLALIGQLREVSNKSTADINNNEANTRTNINNAAVGVNLNVNQKINGLSSQLTTTQNSLTGSINNTGQSILGALQLAQANIMASVNGSSSNITNSVNASSALTNQIVVGTSNRVEQNLTSAIVNTSNSVKQAVESKGSYLQQAVDSISEKLNGLSGIFEGDLTDVLGSIDGSLTNFASMLFATLDVNIGDFKNWKRDITNGAIKDSGDILDKVKEIFDSITKGKYSDYNQLVEDFNNLIPNGDLLSIILIGYILITSLDNIVPVIFAPFLQKVSQLVNQVARSNILNEGQIFSLLHEGWLNYSDAKKNLTKLGYTDVDAENLLTNSWNAIPLDMLFSLLNRGIVNGSDFNYYLSKMGFRDRERDILQELRFNIPSIQDMIMFAVREVYNPVVAQQYGLFEDFPQQFLEQAKLNGLMPEDAKKYWAAHWQLPSPQMAFQMYQRRIISKQDLETLLRSLDIMPYWRNKLTDLAYNPLTRVDVRRMYGFGVLNEQDVYNAYLDDGYSPENAKRLTEFTIKYETSNDETDETNLKTLTRSVIEKGFKLGVLTREEAIERLKDIKYDKDSAELLLSLIEAEEALDLKPDRKADSINRAATNVINAYKKRLYSKEESLALLIDLGFTDKLAEQELLFADIEYSTDFKESVVNEIKSLFVEGTLDENQLLQTLIPLGFSTGEINQLVNDLRVFKSFKGKKLTPAQYINAYGSNIIDYDTLYQKLSDLGYPDDEIGILLLLEGITGD